MKKYILFTLINFCVLAGCTTTDTISPDRNGLLSINATVQFIAQDGTFLPREFFPNSVVILMPYLPGAIFGNPLFGPIFAEQLPKNHELSINLKSAVYPVRENAENLSEEWNSKGLDIVPINTKLARVGTFAFDSNTEKEIGFGGFINPTTKDILILVYVNQSCDITGSVTLGKVTYQHNIIFPNAGFHFIRSRKVEKNRYLLEYSPEGSPVMFSIRII